MGEMAVSEPELWIECIRCKRETRHEVLHEHCANYTDEQYGVTFGETHRIVRCLGCHNVSFESQEWDSSHGDAETGEPYATKRLYPSRTAGRQPMKTFGWPDKVRRVYEDTIRAFNVNAPILAAAGLRAVVEALCIDQKCQGNDLKHKIDDLVVKGAIAANQVRFLHLHRMLGNEAVHEMAESPTEELTAALDIVEGVLHTIYRLPEIAKDLEAARARRSKP